MGGGAIIEVEGLWKRYGLPRFSVLRHGDADPGPWALRELSLTVAVGETLGIIGRNGAGKSTLLKVLAGVSPPTRGRVAVRGRLFPMIELNAGIHPDLSGRENTFLLAAVMGLSRRRMAARMAAVEAFCELGEWFERPVRTYSSGMVMRLGFAVGLHVDADILLMDEVMGVGDIAFHNKCLNDLDALRQRGRCALFVSHNMFRVRRLCDRVLVLDQGAPVFLGAPDQAVEYYERMMRPAMGQASIDLVGVTLEEIALVDAAGKNSVEQGDAVTLTFALTLSRPLDDVVLGVVVDSLSGVAVIREERLLAHLAPGRRDFRLHWQELRLKVGVYTVRLALWQGDHHGLIFQADQALTLDVTGVRSDFGLYVPDACFTWLGESG